MNVWVKLTRKRVTCFYCNKTIETGEYQVVCQYYMKLKHSEKTWTKVMHFHARNPNCWLDRAIAELEMKPKVEMRGRKPDALSDEDKIVRQKILRQRASVMQRLNAEMNEKMRPEKISRLCGWLDYFAAKIEIFGGVPKSWQ